MGLEGTHPRPGRTVPPGAKPVNGCVPSLVRLNRYEFQMCAASVVTVVDLLQITAPGTHVVVASFTDPAQAMAVRDQMNAAFWLGEGNPPKGLDEADPTG